MRLIGAGLPRTGTLSQKVALEMLGLAPCYHMVNVLADLDQAQLWRSALDGAGPWPELFDGFQAMVDWPGAFFYKELIEVYPDAKVLLSVRDSEAWERSMSSTVWGILFGEMLMRDLSTARSRIDPKWHAFLQMMQGFWQRSGLLSTGGGPDSESMRSGMERFNEEVQMTVPTDRLLVWSVTDGWEPLCRFLQLPVPAVPFPHVNDSQEFVERVVDGALLTLREWRAQDSPAPVAR